MDKLLYLCFIFFLVFVSSSPPTNKKKKYEAESSCAGANKRLQVDLDTSSMHQNPDRSEGGSDNWRKNIRQLAINLVDNIDTFENDCSPEAFSRFDESDQLGKDQFFDRCDSQASEWLLEKITRLRELGEAINRWLNPIATTIKKGETELILEKDLRDRKFVKERFQTWTNIHKIDKYENFDLKAMYDVSRRAYYIGDGICVNILAPPFDRVEKFIEIVAKDKTHLLKLTEELKNKIFVPTSLKIYVLQNLCRKFRSNPRNKTAGNEILTALNTEEIEKTGLIHSHFHYHLTRIKDEEKTEKCDWNSVFKRKEVYRLLRLLQGQDGFLQRKKEVDASIDAFVKHCLTKISQFKGGADEIYRKIKDQESRELVQELASRLKNAIDTSNLPLERSVNKVLDIRSESSFREHLLAYLKQKSMFSDNHNLLQLLVHLLQGHLGDFTKGIFREPIYEKKIVEYETLEFLTHVFDIDGYKPKPEIESALLNFYYLYKVSEICKMIPVLDDFTFHRPC